MTPPALGIGDLEDVYDILAEAIDRAGPERSELFLSKLALVLAHAVGDPAAVQAAIATALQDL